MKSNGCGCVGINYLFVKVLSLLVDHSFEFVN